MVTTSASGLDPDITPDNAYFQAPRIAKARGTDEDAIRKLIAEHTEGRTARFYGRAARECAGSESRADDAAK